jgi:mono/diheme cytochrome c family protein
LVFETLFRGAANLDKVKNLKAFIISTAIVAGSLLFQFTQKPVHAAPQTEAAPQGSANSGKDPGAESYAQHCAICHGDQRQGILPGFPPLIGINSRMTDDKITQTVHAGKGRMPGFPSLNDGELSALVHFLTTAEPSPQGNGAHGNAPWGVAEAGGALFQQNCAFCHGRDAMGGETGPDLTESKLVLSDKTGGKIAQVIREGRPDNRMPAFNLSSEEVGSIIAFIRAREAAAVARPGGRRGVAVADLQTGNVEAGRKYFDGPGGCGKCHSPNGDLAGVATRYEGLQLEERMLYPRGAKSTVTVTTASGQKISGTLAYLDEFTVALRDRDGIYHSWPISRVHYAVQSPVDAHAELFSKYTDDDIHNLMAYLQTLR